VTDDEHATFMARHHRQCMTMLSTILCCQIAGGIVLLGLKARCQ
jgi:hypothetical protein